MVASKLMKYVGTIIVNSIKQGGPSLPVFSSAVYQYLCIGNTDAAMTEMTIADCSEPIEDFISRVSNTLQCKASNNQFSPNTPFC